MRKRTGDLLWTSAPGKKPYDTTCSTPIIKTINGVRLLIDGHADGSCVALQSRTGKPVWRFLLSKRGLNCSPVTWGNRVYIAHGEDNHDNTEFGRIQCIDGSGHGDITSTHSVWQVDGIRAGFAGLLVKDGILFVNSDSGTLHALDAKTGVRLWRHNIGTMGRGSPVWADGKLYVTGVNGNVHILKVTRDECSVLSKHQLTDSQGAYNDIFGSFAVSYGRLYLATRDVTYCLGKAGPWSSTARIVEPAKAGSSNDQNIAQLVLTPFEVALRPGSTQQYRLRGYNAKGKLIKEVPLANAQLAGLDGVTIKSNTLMVSDCATHTAGTITTTFDGLSATARIRVFPKLNWKWSFDSNPGVPKNWLRAFGKLKQQEGVLRHQPSRGRPSAYITLGPTDLAEYTIEADVRVAEARRQMSSIGITAQRYNLILMGNTQQLELQSWAPQRRMAKSRDFEWDPDVWYRMKLRVSRVSGKPASRRIQGKVWRRSGKEPTSWTIDTVDPFANQKGSPGLYLYSLTQAEFDNIHIHR